MLQDQQRCVAECIYEICAWLLGLKVRSVGNVACLQRSKYAAVSARGH